MNTKICILLLTIVFIVGHEWHVLTHIGYLQNSVANTANTAIVVANATRVGPILHGAIHIQDNKIWAETKADSIKLLEGLISITSSKEEETYAKAAIVASDKLIRLYEDKIRPSNDLVSHHSEVDAYVRVIQTNVLKISLLIAEKTKEAEKNFTSEIYVTRVVTLVVGIFGVLLQAGLITWLANTSIKIAIRDIKYDDLDNTKDIKERLSEIKKKLSDTDQA